MPNQYTVKRTRVQRLKKLLNPNTPKKKFLTFIIVFMLIGGGYMAYRSFAATPNLSGADGEFTALTPARILDTRTGNGGYTTPTGQTPRKVQVTGKGGVPVDHVRAVVMNVTVTGGTAGSYFSIYPTGSSRPISSNLNFAAGETRPNQVTVKVGDDGSVQLFNAVGTAHAIFDVAGYYTDAGGAPGARFSAVTPARILDTRTGAGGYKAPLGQDSIYDVQILDRGGVPATNVTAVVMNVTVTGGTAGSFLTVYPSDTNRPTASSLNFGPGQTTSNQVTVKVGANGKVKVHNALGSAHVIFDVAGYYEILPSGFANTQRGRFVPVTPSRVLDTRSNQPIFDGLHPFDLNGAGGVAGEYIDAVVANVTVTGGTANSFLTVWPTNNVQPNTSNVNFAVGQTVSNQVTVGVGTYDRKVDFSNANGTVEVIVDVAGYFLKDQSILDAHVGGSIHAEPFRSAQKMEYDYIPGLSTKNGSFAIGSWIIYGNTPLDTFTTYAANPTISVVDNKTYISFTCRSTDKCQSLLPGTVKQVLSDGGATFTTPFAVDTSHFTDEIIKDKAGYPGKWSFLSITTDGLTKNVFAKYLGPTAGTAAFGSSLNFDAHEPGISCDSPYALSSRIGGLKFDGSYMTLAEPGIYAAQDSSYANCPGVSRVDITNGDSGQIFFSARLGIPKAERDVIAPVITASSVAKKIATVSATDNVTVALMRVGVDNSYGLAPMSGGCCGSTNSPNATLQFDLSKIPVGQHTLNIQIIDNSGNRTDKNVPIIL